MLNINNKPCKNCGNKTTVTANVAEVQKTIPTYPQKISQRIENPDCEGVTVHCNDPWLKIVVRDDAGVVVKLINLPHSEAEATYNAFVEANPNANYTVTFYQCCNDINAPTCVDCAANDECPEGTACINGTCLDPDSLCEDGQIFVAGNCYDTPIDGECANGTTPVTLWDGVLICTQNGNCPTGTVDIEGVCYLTATTQSQCPSGTTLVNGVCYLTAENGNCPTGTTNVSGICYPSAVNGVCPTGTTNVNGVCYTNAVNGVCPNGTTNVNGVCYPSMVNGVCPSGTTNVNGVCVITNIGGCPDGTTNVNGVCYPNSTQGSCDTGTPVTLWDGTVICLANSDCPDGTTNVNGVCYLTPVDGECAEGYEPMVLECNITVCLPLPDENGDCPGDLVPYNGLCYIPYDCPSANLKVIAISSDCVIDQQTVVFAVVNQGADVFVGDIDISSPNIPNDATITVSQGTYSNGVVSGVTLDVNVGSLIITAALKNSGCQANTVSLTATSAYVDSDTLDNTDSIDFTKPLDKDTLVDTDNNANGYGCNGGVLVYPFSIDLTARGGTKVAVTSDADIIAAYAALPIPIAVTISGCDILLPNGETPTDIEVECLYDVFNERIAYNVLYPAIVGRFVAGDVISLVNMGYNGFGSNTIFSYTLTAADATAANTAAGVTITSENATIVANILSNLPSSVSVTVQVLKIANYSCGINSTVITTVANPANTSIDAMLLINGAVPADATATVTSCPKVEANLLTP